MSKLNEILTGWGNRVKDSFNLLDEETKLMAEARLTHCNFCEIRNSNTCDPAQTIQHVKTRQDVNGCGCNISAKTLSPNSHCPAGKW